MAASGISLQAYLVIDNNVLVLLNEFCCHRWAAQVGPSRLIGDIVSWIGEKVSLLASLTLDQCIHCPDQVVAEFLPGSGRLRPA